jgi:hypothetical protein
MNGIRIYNKNETYLEHSRVYLKHSQDKILKESVPATRIDAKKFGAAFLSFLIARTCLRIDIQGSYRHAFYPRFFINLKLNLIRNMKTSISSHNHYSEIKTFLTAANINRISLSLNFSKLYFNRMLMEEAMLSNEKVKNIY